MKKKTIIHILFVAFAMLFVSEGYAQQTAYDFSITTLDGQKDSLSQFAGKKIAIVIIPSTESLQDSIFLDTLNAIAARYADSLTIIGIPSYETGYQDDSLSSLTIFYDSLVQAPCVIAQGVNTTKLSGYQDALFVWLTNVSQNGHFDEDVESIGQSFFIDNYGKLYAVFTPQQPFNDALVQTMLQPAEQPGQ